VVAVVGLVTAMEWLLQVVVVVEEVQEILLPTMEHPQISLLFRVGQTKSLMDKVVMAVTTTALLGVVVV
tara:strand:- start:374 stop:580 length:207 start_codon:yes stop_codon:yes gene_type:complete